ncbi:MAG: Zn-dependent hydrolase [Desulfovibrio sp.]|jgi:N-carbamoyl-L-amino-acid hydrolase|nr:Zn-dependent hydrolase [Desulfovibrio sp.]
MPAVSRERLKEKIDRFKTFGRTGRGGISRLSLSPPALEARAEFCRRCRALGLDVTTDDLANIYATRGGTEALPRIVTGSHLDSVVRGGCHDGTLGVLAALEVVETLVGEGVPTRHPLTVMVWTNEEGVRFPPAMMSSGVLAGKFGKEAVLAVRDADGVSFAEALRLSGYQGEERNRLNPRDCLAYLELHIEQGPVLHDAGETVGVVLGVAGMCNYTITVSGQANHAGATPMGKRRDALFAASRLICRLHEELAGLDESLVFTFGRIDCFPNLHTIVPGEVSFSLDARHQDRLVLRRVVEAIKSLPPEIESCAVRHEEAWAREPTAFAPELVEYVRKNADALGYPNRDMYSGAGHDAQYAQDMLPSAMIFVPSINGLSHCEEESTNLDDCWKGANVLLNTILDVDGSGVERFTSEPVA